MKITCVFVSWLLVLTPLAAQDADLLGHWKLAGDARDHSGNANHGNNHKADLSATEGAKFDGRSSMIVVEPSPSLKLGTDPFSIAVWVGVDRDLDDVVGDVISQYDPEKRQGFHLSIMNHAGVTSSQANDRNLHFGIDNARSEPKWTDHGRLGNAVLIYAMAVHDGQLFVGTCEAGKDEAGRVFRFDGSKWTDCGSPDRCNAVSALAVYRGDLYAGVSKYRLGGSALPESENPHPGGAVYRYAADGKWVACGALPETEAIGGMAVYRGKLYAGSMYRPAGFFRYEGGTEWSDCGTPDGKRVEALAVHNGHLYATGYDEGAAYRYGGKGWTHLGRVGEARQTYGFAVYQGKLHVSEWPNAKVYRYGGQREWIYAGRLGEELEAMPLLVYNGKLYAGTLPSAEVYRYDGGETWAKIARLDFTPGVRYRRTWTMAVYKGRLFAGTLPSGRVHSIEIGKNVTHDAPLQPGWHHVAAVKDRSRLRLYVNGELVGTSTNFDAADYDLTSDQPIRIGFGARDHFNGRMRDVRIYRRALNAEDVKKLARP